MRNGRNISKLRLSIILNNCDKLEDTRKETDKLEKFTKHHANIQEALERYNDIKLVNPKANASVTDIL